MSLRIAVLTSQFPLASQTFVVNQVRGLIERGHDVHVFPLDGRPSEGWSTSDTDLLARTHYPPPVPRNRTARLARGATTLLGHLPRAPRVILRSLDVIRFPRDAASLRLLHTSVPFLDQPVFDVVYCQFGTIGLTASALRRIDAVRGRLAVTFRGHDISRHVQRYGRNVYAQLFNDADLFFTNCSHFRRRLLELGCPAEKLNVVRSGVDLQFFAAQPPRKRDGTFRIACVGRLVEKKGFATAVRALAIAQRKRAGLSIDVIGAGPLREALETLAHDLGVRESVHFHGAGTRTDVRALLQDSDLLLAPSQRAPDGDEDAPVNTLKEAMAVARPVVATLHGGIPELVEDGRSGYLVAEGDATAMAARILRLAEDTDRAAAMGQAGRAFVERHYDLRALNDDLADHLEALARRGLDTSAPLDVA